MKAMAIPRQETVRYFSGESPFKNNLCTSDTENKKNTEKKSICRMCDPVDSVSGSKNT